VTAIGIETAGAASAGPLKTAAARRRLRTWGGLILREPLFHFFLVGLVLFVAAERHRTATDVYRIVVTPERVAKLTNAYRLQFGADPTPAGLEVLIDKDIDEEVLYREGVALKLDRDDAIVRRRVVQKMQFLEQDLAAPAEPTEAELQRYYPSHLARYATPEKVSFSHIYFSADRGGDQAARQRAEVALAGLDDGTTRAPDRGDSFPDLYDYSSFGPDQAVRLFGDGEFSHMLFKAPVGHWAGPFRSSYGWHLVRVQSKAASRTPPVSEIRDQVRDDAIAAAQVISNEKSFQALKARFTVVRQDRAQRR
jgi:peptidyl-prolyl cis-trans isomerase C